MARKVYRWNPESRRVEEVQQCLPSERVHIIGDDIGYQMWCPALPKGQASSYFESRSRYNKTVRSLGYEVVGDSYVGKQPVPLEKRVPRPDVKTAFEKAERALRWRNDSE